MAYRQDGDLRDLFPKQDWVEEVAHDIVDELGTRIRDGAAKRTPVARLPEAYRGDFEAWIADRGGRVPRTLRDSWVKGRVITEGDYVTVEIENLNEPICLFVEEVTRPHLIRAHIRPDGRQGSLRYPMGPSFHYNVEVWHPGTQGVHMMRDTLAEIQVSWDEVADGVLDRKIEEWNARY